jgi:DNA-directed RNA polymerase specialized sigma24 family protein
MVDWVATEKPGDWFMSAVTFELERNRELLSQAIMDVLKSWPELHRRVFEQAHYQGNSVEKISGSLGLSATDVRLILESCDRKLRSALRSFRSESHSDATHYCQRRAAFSVSGCFR